MSEIIIRRAVEGDQSEVARMIVDGFHNDFSKISEKLDHVAAVIQNGTHIERFFIAKGGEETVGILACTDCRSRAVSISMAACRKYFGFVKGTLAGAVMISDFSKQLRYPPTTGYIEFVAVAEKERKKGLATKMLHAMMEQTEYKEYLLDVMETNIAAQLCYLKFGFVEFERTPVCFSKWKGFSSKIYMRYIK